MSENNSGGNGVLGVLVGALVVILVGGGILFATGVIGGGGGGGSTGGGNKATMKIEVPKPSTQGAKPSK